jgi:hypothetical protein
MSSSRFEVTANGVDLDIAFSDKLGRQIRLYIREKNQHHCPVPFLAPVGSDVKSPTKLFAVYMKEFDFVVRTGTEISMQIGDRLLTPATFPVPMNNRKVYFIRYASNLVIGEINSMPVKPVVIENVRPGIIKAGDQNLVVDADGNVKECRVEFGNDTIRLNFEPGFPNLPALSQNQKVEGRWQYAVSSDVLFSGIYSLQKEKEKVNIELDVTENWKPGELPFSYRLVTFFVRSFRTWPTTYKWTGTVDLSSNRMLHEKWLRKR